MYTMIPDNHTLYVGIYGSYETAIESIICFGVPIIIFILAYLYYGTNWRPFKKYSKNDDACPNCGEPLHHGNERCKWCGHFLVNHIDETEIVENKYPMDKPHVVKKRPNILLPGIIAIVVAGALILVFVFYADTGCLIFYGIIILLIFLYLLTQSSSLGRKHREGDNLAKEADGRASTPDKLDRYKRI